MEAFFHLFMAAEEARKKEMCRAHLEEHGHTRGLHMDCRAECPVSANCPLNPAAQLGDTHH